MNFLCNKVWYFYFVFGIYFDLYYNTEIRKYNLKIIEDAAHSIGISITSLDKKPMVGSFADITTFSFHPVKNITTCEGGMVVTNNELLYNKMKNKTRITTRLKIFVLYSSV